MIVALDDIKEVLGIPLTDTSHDVTLTRIIKAKTVWVEGATKRRFDTPILHVQFEESPGTDALYLEWNLDDQNPVTAPDPDPATSVHVFRRPMCERTRAWEELIEGEDWERRGQSLLFLRTWQLWPFEDEIKIEYLAGYTVPPEDIQELIMEMSVNQYLSDTNVSSGTSGLTSEKIGDYSYSGNAVVSTVLSTTGSGGFSKTGLDTINRYKRRFM